MNTKELKVGRELDAKVATEVMGWIWIPSELNDEQNILVPSDKSITIPDSSWWWARDVKALVPHYSTDIAAALLLLDGETDVSIEKAGAGWAILLVSTMSEGRGKTLPLAICRAKLEAVEQTHEPLS